MVAAPARIEGDQPTTILMLRSDFDDPIQVPRSPAAPWIQILFWIFMLSFAFDYRAGDGIGDSFYWDHEYFPELYMVYSVAELDEISRDIWYAGHSVWTYALFSGGVIGLAAFAGLFASTVVLSLRSAAANARLPGPDYWLLFLPTVATFCLLSESATSNAFDERLLGMSALGFLPRSHGKWVPEVSDARATDDAKSMKSYSSNGPPKLQRISTYVLLRCKYPSF